MSLSTQANQFWDGARRMILGSALGCVVVYASGCSAPVARRSAGVWGGEGGSSAAVAFLPQGPSALSASEEYWAGQSDNARRDAALASGGGEAYQPAGMWPERDVPTVERPYYINLWRSSESYLIFRRGSRETRGWYAR